MKIRHPVQLIIGTAAAAEDAAAQIMMQVLCSHGGCGNCRTCRGIRQGEHARLLWVRPTEEQYLRQDLAPIASLLGLQQELEQPYFILLRHADTLSISCATSLLKSLEEPPAPYQFILTATTVAGVLPTIVSRSLISYCHAEQERPHPITALLLDTTATAAQFAAALAEESVTETTVTTIIDELLLASARQPRLAKHHKLVQELHRHSIMPASGPLALKMLFVALH